MTFVFAAVTIRGPVLTIPPAIWNLFLLDNCMKQADWAKTIEELWVHNGYLDIMNALYKQGPEDKCLWSVLAMDHLSSAKPVGNNIPWCSVVPTRNRVITQFLHLISFHMSCLHFPWDILPVHKFSLISWPKWDPGNSIKTFLVQIWVYLAKMLWDSYGRMLSNWWRVCTIQIVVRILVQCCKLLLPALLSVVMLCWLNTSRADKKNRLVATGHH